MKILVWLAGNAGTILIALLLAAAVAWVIIYMLRRRGSGCGCGCENCAMKGKCHK